MRDTLRTMLVWCPDWPVIAADLIDGVPADRPVAVLHANRVVASSAAARAEGVRRGLRKREAQARCPQLIAVDYDPVRDVRAFEPVLAAVEEVAASVAVLRAGVCAFAARGPARYHGGEEAAAERIIEQVAQECRVEAQIGVADGTFAALLAARMGRVVPPGRTPEFLAGMPVGTLDRPQLAGLLRRLGITTLGAFAALPPSDVLARFGLDAALAQHLAAGRDDRPLAVRQAPPDLEVDERFDEPVNRVDTAAFAARALAERLHERLAGYGMACTRLAIAAVTADGRELHRVWRHDGILTAGGIADRTRWQLEGWITRRQLGPGPSRHATTHDRPDQGIVALRLIPDGLVRQVGLQAGLWGDPGVERDRAHRALHRVQGILGPEAVVTAVLGGGRDPREQATLVPWGDERIAARPAGPWPGRLPPPSPAVVLDQPQPARLLDAYGQLVGVSARLELTAEPDRLVLERGAVEVVGWAGPWPVDEQWWDSRRAVRAVRLQVLLADGRALLLTLSAAEWTITLHFD
ncbi:DNA polymerase Y family protein [Catellatospora sp. KI3]|uniref:DNA polymerase Y family protein n=1 Tax=Catellatospora sp. KI3 TaxID=3041620 RepID=UPI00248272A6|nr:DNA polymerase Y family protein [Catellatospora sp. KI3]MDI1464890.1 DNA polymerase Y family protein [Catellatospora sp. KI3]